MTNEKDSRGQRELEISVWMEQYKVVTSNNASRVEMQERNVSVYIVFITAVIGLIFHFWDQSGYEKLISSQAILLVPAVPLVALLFLLKHLEHNTNLIDQIVFIEERIRPRVVDLIGQDVLGYEEFIQMRRHERFKRLKGLPHLATDPAIIVFSMGPFFFFGWYLFLFKSNFAGSAHLLFEILLWLESPLLVFAGLSLWFSAKIRSYK